MNKFQLITGIWDLEEQLCMTNILLEDPLLFVQGKIQGLVSIVWSLQPEIRITVYNSLEKAKLNSI